MMKKMGLTATILFLAESANYGESLGNVANLKKITRGNGSQYTYISRQALRYNIVEELDEPEAPVTQDGENSKAVIQFDSSATIADYPELDFFGYLKTEKGSNGEKRSAKVRLSNAISLEPYMGDSDFLTNMGLAERRRAEIKDPKKKDEIHNSIAQSQTQRSYYRYTVTIDLDKIGIDPIGNIQISNDEKSRRVQQLLDTLAFLYRDIRGRREDLKPLFIVGGVYDVKNPLFQNLVNVDNNEITIDPIANTIQELQTKDEQDETVVGMVPKQFSNSDALKTQLNASSVGETIKQLKQKVADYYESN
ncbi:hypothetical protein IV38_GL000153 [Lactobacillus selangorensis]|uniref:Crispr-associated regulatory protein, devr family n=1 Tax=Lactobacillus selangorensis TaxID=81857 RepID=A0A0R2G105_9LACO|nr:type I-B CRISPR-associated protein Cas7/Cst2/DevR [Lactobacillus selangorensis]KRN29271.1 hypothetical protein IV38_GL000153 [Lactobacillus selangorensis]KRN34200.1 hypothetical protein IV40_GL000516 [Lactobacillus selangorensis]